MPAKAGKPVAVVWFRKGLRLHDNAALVEAAGAAGAVCPVFVLDPWFAQPARVGANRYSFLLESLRDLDGQLRKKYGSRLLVLRGSPDKVLGQLLTSGKPLLGQRPDLILWERDTEPYALARDTKIAGIAAQQGVEVRTFSGHTLYDCEVALAKNKGKAPSTMPGMVSLAKALGEPEAARPAPGKLPAPPREALARADKDFAVPSLQEMGYKATSGGCPFPGGETEGLRRLEAVLKKSAYVCGFEKPKTQSTAFDPPSTTGLSPYLKFGCVSARHFYHALKKAIAGKQHSQPPGSLIGQLYFREIAYLQGASIPNFDRQEGNPACRPIPWGSDAKLLAAWEEGRTGYPFIDACMRQLARTGWLHHLARHAVACFLTRGDLWLSWERGRDVFDRLLVDADWSLNNQNWLALAGVAPWSPPFFRVYHPAPKMDSSLNVRDPEGTFIREFVPELRQMPSKYIYEPWTAPLDEQKKAGCVVGKDYPKRVVDHEKVSKENIARFKKALSTAKSAGGGAASAAAAAASPRKRAGAAASSTAAAAASSSPRKRAGAAAKSAASKRPKWS